jgi:hypothetical protein
MKVKIGNKIYNSDDQPIMLIISNGEKEQITNMPGKKYCVYPAYKYWIDNNYKNIKDWMKQHT